MNLRSSLLTAAAVSLLPLALSAQVAPAPGATATPAPAATPAKKTPLASGDKQLIKSSAEPQLMLLHMSEIIAGPTPPGSPAVQKLAAAAKKAMTESWGDLGTVALGRGEMPPTTQSPAEKKDLGELRKLTGDKFDKAFVKAFQKEAKRANTTFTAGAKSALDPDLKAAFAKHQPIVAKLEADAVAAEAEGKKK
jgi:predicted outer membrane protein